MTEPTRAPSEILRAAKARIADKKHWTRYKAARDRHRHAVPPTDERAVRWCGLGAFTCETAGEPQQLRDAVWRFIEQSVGPYRSLATTNDLEGHRAVMEVYAEAIRLAALAEAADVDA